MNNLLKPMNLVIAAVAVVLVLGAGYFFLNRTATTPTAPATEEEVMEEESVIEAESTVVVLSEQNDSGQSGTATLTEVDGQTNVLVELDVPSDVAQPAHIHSGACPDVGDVVYPLANVVDGVSETILGVDLATLMGELPLAINVHQSAEQISVYTSCGDL